MSFVRKPAVAGSFYPEDPGELQRTVDNLLTQAASLITDDASQDTLAKPLRQLMGLQVPHAGYIYSGLIAAVGYQLIKTLRPRRVVIAGPTHRVGFRGIALSEAVAFATPLGEIPVDQNAQQYLVEHSSVAAFFEPSHTEEHALEVQLPFLQTVFRDLDFSIVPLAVGDCTPEGVCDTLQTLVSIPGENPDDTLIIISSDLSHYLSYDEARKLDTTTLSQVMSLEYSLDPRQACGAYAWSGLIRLARRLHWHPQLLMNASSGDTAGDKSRVVGYSSVAFWKYNPPEDEFGIPNRYGSLLPQIAREILTDAFRDSKRVGSMNTLSKFSESDRALQLLLRSVGASFVTLTKHGQLRGCIGSLAPHRMLGEDIAANALAAAFEDPRFAPLHVSELEEIHIEVSVLTKPQPFERREGESNESYLSRLRPGTDGVILRRGFHHATFLPQVWSELPDVHDFISQLMYKAGLSAEEFGPEIRLETYQVQAWGESPDEPSTK